MLDKRYYWKHLTDDGLLKDPEALGPYYSSVDFNSYDGFDSEEEAIKHYEYIIDSFKYGVEYSLVLITVYRQS